jgi:ketosteroid isomerase-like protein
MLLRRFAATVTLLSAASCNAAPAPPSGAAAVNAIRELVRTYDAAWLAKDTTTAARLLAPDYVYFTSTGRLTSRSESLAFLSDTSYVLVEMDRSEVEIALAGPVARVSSRWRGTGRYQGAPVRDDQTCGQIWIWAEGRWRLFAEHCVNRPGGTAVPEVAG